MTSAHNLPPNFDDTDPMLKFYEQELIGGIDKFLKQTHQRLRRAQVDHDAMMGRGNDISLVRPDDSQIGKLACRRLRFTPDGLIDPAKAKVGVHPVYEKVEQLIVEIPNLYSGRAPEAVFVTITGANDVEDHIIVSQRRLSWVDPRDENTEVIEVEDGKLLLCRTTTSNDLSSLEDLGIPEDLSLDELVHRLSIAELLYGIAEGYKIGNQSRNDGTAA